MVGSGLSRRVNALEARVNPHGVRRWHRVLQYEDETTEQAVAAYEAKNGPIGPDDGTILRVFISKPFLSTEMSPCPR